VKDILNIQGKLALVTGASGGIGRAIAQQLSAQGAHLILSGTRREALEETQACLTGESAIICANLGTTEGVSSLIQEVSAQGDPDIVVANAGITRDNLFIRMKPAEWEEVLRVNLISIIELCHGLVRPMIKKGWGRIVNLSSIVGSMGNIGQTNYAAAKAGLEGFTKSLAREVAKKGVTVNAVAPGFISTAMTSKIPESIREKLLEKIPVGHMGQPEDIASAVLYLASEAGRYITGQTLHVNGGMLMS
jgi:3-oxoacyl-[acyl-carrier protein] reductase